jgi:periplasmic copper chaperone A
MKILITFILITLFSFISHSHKYETENVLVDHPWMKIMNKNGAGYFKIQNTGTADVHLLGVVSKNVKNIELHTMVMEEGVAKMRPINGGVVIKIGDTIEFKPMSYHLMFFDIKNDYNEGEFMKAVFKFKNANDLEVKFKIDSKKSSHKH